MVSLFKFNCGKQGSLKIYAKAVLSNSSEDARLIALSSLIKFLVYTISFASNIIAVLHNSDKALPFFLTGNTWFKLLLSIFTLLYFE